MRDLLIAGAGGLARATASAVAAINAVDPQWTLRGFLDDDPALHGASRSGVPVLGGVDSVPTEIDTIQRRLMQLELADRQLAEEVEEHAHDRRAEIQAAALRGLGLGKIGRTRTLEDTPAVRGMVNKIPHLVTIIG